MPVTQRDVDALTYLAGRIREETYGCGRWDGAGIHAQISKLVGQNLGIAVERVVRNTADPQARTPAAILRPFVPDTAPGPIRQTPPKRAEECPKHPGQRAVNCGGCAADRNARRDDDELAVDAPLGNTRPLEPERRAALVAEIRQTITTKHQEASQ
jgi:hypothetical protein